MKFLPIWIFACFTFFRSEGQSVTCDGQRFLKEVFTNIKMSTVQFGKNISVYGDSIPLYMDVYEPVGDDATIRPAMVLAFGGSFIAGDRTQLAEQGKYYAGLGYVAACIDYRTWPIFLLGFPDSARITDVSIKAMGDMKASIRFLKSEASNFRVDTNLIFSGGVSAGSITSIHSAYLDASDSIPPYLKKIIDANGGFEGSSNNSTLKYSSKVAGLLNLSGGIFKLDWIDTGEPPMTSIHGTADITVPYNYGLAGGLVSIHGSGDMYPVLKANNINASLVSVPNGGHTDIYFLEEFKPYLDSFMTISNKMFYDIICKTVVATSDKSNAQLIKVYPNPAIDHIYIESSAVIKNVRMYNLFGKYIPVSFQNNRINWSQRLAPGIYAVEILLKDNSRVYNKVLVE